MIEDFNKEYFIVLGLNTKNKIIFMEVVSIGILNKTIIHSREVFRRAIINNCNAIIVAHNHPTGDPLPSVEDKIETTRLKNQVKY